MMNTQKMLDECKATLKEKIITLADECFTELVPQFDRFSWGLDEILTAQEGEYKKLTGGRNITIPLQKHKKESGLDIITSMRENGLLD